MVQHPNQPVGHTCGVYLCKNTKEVNTGGAWSKIIWRKHQTATLMWYLQFDEWNPFIPPPPACAWALSATLCNHNILTHTLSKLDELNGETTLLDKTVYGVENSSTFMECSPKSQRAVIYWQYQQSADDHKREVGTPHMRCWNKQNVPAEQVSNDRWFLVILYWRYHILIFLHYFFSPVSFYRIKLVYFMRLKGIVVFHNYLCPSSDCFQYLISDQIWRALHPHKPGLTGSHT